MIKGPCWLLRLPLLAVWLAPWLAVPGAARADEAPRPAVPAAAPAPAAEAPEDPDAMVLRARAALDARDFQVAATLLEAAYARRPAPELLFYLGEAYRGQPAAAGRALRFFRRYLAEEQQPAPELRERATAAIAELSARQAEARGPRPAVRGVPAAPELGPAPEPAPAQVLSMRPAQAPPPPPIEKRGPGPTRRGALVLLGAGVALGATGGLLLSQSVSQADAARDAETFTAHVDELSRARQLLGAGAACLAIAGAAALSGGALLLLSHLGRRAEERLAVLPLPGGFLAEGRF